LKAIIVSISVLLFGLISFGQNIINSDTTLSRTIRVNDSFELQYLDWPGTGYSWYLTANSDTSSVSIVLIKQALAEGYGPKGGKYISFYKYTGLKKGLFVLEYRYGRPWLKEKLYKCILKISVI